MKQKQQSRQSRRQKNEQANDVRMDHYVGLMRVNSGTYRGTINEIGNGFLFLKKRDKSVKEGRLRQTHRTGRRSGQAGCGDDMGRGWCRWD